MKDIKACQVDKSYFATQDEEGRSPLHFAARRGNIELAKHIINLLPSHSINQADCNGQTAFHYAAESKRVEIIDVLKDSGMDIHSKDQQQRSLLHHAALCGNVDAIKKVIIIVGRQALDLRDIDGRTPFLLAERYGVRSTVEYLTSAYGLERGAETAFDTTEDSRWRCGDWMKMMSRGMKGLCSVRFTFFALSVILFFLRTTIH